MTMKISAHDLKHWGTRSMRQASFTC